MHFATWPSGPVGPIVATAIHTGHEVRPDVAEHLALDPASRLREEDPGTDRIAAGVPHPVVVHRSRFEVDLNRPPDEAVYIGEEDAWGTNPWSRPLPEPVVDESRRLHADFYSRLAGLLDGVVEAHGGFVLYDVHSYNHRRGGPEAPPEPPEDNPQVNLGTGSMPSLWRPVADAFLEAMGAASFAGNPIDARENVKFKGRQLAAFVHERYGDRGCALAIEFRKDYMDEWTGEIDEAAVAELAGALAASTTPVWEVHQRCR